MGFDPTTLDIDPDIRRARTLPAQVYRDPQAYACQRQGVFARSWQPLPTDARPQRVGDLQPWNLLAGCLDEPLLLTRDAAGLHCLSNVCTHRGNVLVERPCSGRKGLRCGYHGRRFALDGRFVSMPGFDEAIDFPSPADDLPKVQTGVWGPLLFASLAPAVPLSEWLAPLRRISFLPLGDAVFRPEASRHYELRANWALYVDNYLEGLHIPYVHPGLAPVLDLSAYRVETSDWGALQIGVASPGELAFEVPPGHVDHGLAVAGYYYWLFPNTMINVYPWGLSINVVMPLAVDHTKIVYLTYVWDPTAYDRGAGSSLDAVEFEDEKVVESCARGLRSSLYDRGRYAPNHERAVHHFHRLLVVAMQSQG